MSLVIYKLGGSLLDLDDWQIRLRRLWKSRPSDERQLLIVGGGRAADLVREWDNRFALGEEKSHELALESLRLTEELAAHLLPECSRIPSQAEFLANPRFPGLISVKSFLDSAESPLRPVPRHWEFTTDSTSAWIGGILQADELVLLKSVSLPECLTTNQLSAAGLVDREFPHWASQLPLITWYDLRSESCLTVSSTPCPSPDAMDADAALHSLSQTKPG